MNLSFISFTELLAALTFIPMGFIMGYLLSAFGLDGQSSELIIRIKFWPFLGATIIAVLTAGVMMGLKSRFGKYIFEHFYMLALGQLAFLIGGILLVADETKVGIYMSFIGHGACYIPALTYINIRGANDAPRNFNISLAHIFYFLGAAITASLVTGRDYHHFNLLTRNVGILLIIGPSVLLAGFIVCEIFRSRYKIFAYKQSLDKNLNSENLGGKIFTEQYFAIADQDFPNLEFRPGNLVAKEISMIVYVVISKTTSIVYFYYPFYFYVSHFTTLSSGDAMGTMATYVHWAGLIGIILSSIMLLWFSPKSGFLFTTMVKIIWLILCTILVQTSYGSMGLTAILWILFVVNGLGHSFPDIFVLDYATMKFNEFILAITYAAEMLTVGIVFFSFMADQTSWVPSGEPIKYMLTHCLVFGLLFLHLIISGLIVLPAIHNKSLLETKNLCWIQFYGMQKTIQNCAKCKCCKS